LGDAVAHATKTRKPKKVYPLVTLDGYRAKVGFVLTTPIHLVGESNARENPMVRSSRAKKQRKAVTFALNMYLGEGHGPDLVRRGPIDVTITRLAPARSRFDEGDNEAMCAKHIRDGIAAWFGVNDRSGERVRYDVKQVAHEVYGCRIWIRRRTTT
jgi:hypothetical protein